MMVFYKLWEILRLVSGRIISLFLFFLNLGDFDLLVVVGMMVRFVKRELFE